MGRYILCQSLFLLQQQQLFQERMMIQQIRDRLAQPNQLHQQSWTQWTVYFPQTQKQYLWYQYWLQQVELMSPTPSLTHVQFCSSLFLWKQGCEPEVDESNKNKARMGKTKWTNKSHISCLNNRSRTSNTN